jgi:carboxyl-terminal processing protease
MAAQLRESIGAPIVGELTSGKGYAQNLFLLPNGGAINMSTTRYCTGSGISLIGTGIVPDVETSDINEQLQTAIDLLKR